MGGIKMNLSDRRVVAFREWAERRFAIGSGGYPEGEDLLSVVMDAVDARERMWREFEADIMQPEMHPEFASYLRRAMGVE